jgi:glycosyltransferase involved in cell wall biosynthesis
VWIRENPRPVRALILVRNTVSHDARVMREADTLRGLGFEVLIAGVVSTAERERSLELDGFSVARLDPSGGLRSLLPRRTPAASSPVTSAPAAASGAPAPGPRALLRRLLITGVYYLQGIALARRERPALVHANDYNTMWIGIAAKLLCGSRLVYDCHELWADRNGRPEWRPWLVACEALFMRVADATITASPGYADELAQRYRVARPTVIRNIPARRERVADAPAEPGLVVYVGGLMPGRGLEQAIRAVALAPGVRLRLIGPGNVGYRESLHRCAVSAGVADRVELRDAVPPAELVAAIAGAAVGLMLIERTGRSYELTLPNKLFEYAAAGVPILASNMPVLAGVVASEGIGEVVAVDDVAAVAAGMQRLADPSVNAVVAERVRAFGSRETWEREQEVLASVYEPSERGRVAGAYAGYAANRSKQRSWASGNPGNAAIRDELAAAVDAVAGAELRAAEAVLDVGCGTGWWLERLSAMTRASLFGLDVLPERVEAAGHRTPGATVAVGDARALPFEDGRFGVVTMFTVLSSLGGEDDVRHALHEARRVLTPGGVLLIWEPRVPNPFNRHTLLIDRELVRDTLADAEVGGRTTTLLPPLARRLGTRTDRLYPRLVRLAPLRTHHLISARARMRDD